MAKVKALSMGHKPNDAMKMFVESFFREMIVGFTGVVFGALVLIYIIFQDSIDNGIARLYDSYIRHFASNVFRHNP